MVRDADELVMSSLDPAHFEGTGEVPPELSEIDADVP